MTLAFRICAFLAITVAGLFAWQWLATPNDVTQLAVQQFQDDGSVAEKLHDATTMQNWWPLLCPALVVAIGIVMFWNDAEKWWKHEPV
jgi:hypothetical protein